MVWKLLQSAWWAETEAAPRRVPVTARAQLSAAQAMVEATRERITATFMLTVVLGVCVFGRMKKRW